jgi:hypothetical protein
MGMNNDGWMSVDKKGWTNKTGWMSMDGRGQTNVDKRQTKVDRY